MSPLRPFGPRARRLLRGVALSGLLGALVAGCSAAPADDTPLAERDTYRVGLLQIAPATLLDQTVQAFEARLGAQLAPKKVEVDVVNAQGDQSLIASSARDLAGSDADAFAVIGTPAVIALAKQVTDRPVIAIAMGDPVGAGLAASLDAPGGNVTGSVDYVDPALLLDQIMTVQPAPTRLGTLYDPSNQNMVVWTDALKQALAAHPGLELVESTLSGSADVATAARGLVGRADAVLVGPDATVFAGLPAVGAALGGAGLPVYVSGGDASVDGILATIGPDYPAVGALAADAAAQVLAGTPAAQVPFGKPSGVEFGINRATMESLGVTIPQAILSTATVQ
ncbi:ABC transporter substrate-binding protein [Pseudonocardia sp. NPDC049154]|uniref:ABC transporter substrate-binding protein n=1 Tax=Pseudonocardia sp. NPDC049154 TaxID=3155501 RepID=UPI0033E81B20